MDKRNLFQLPQPAASNSGALAPAPQESREREQALAERAATMPAAVEEQSIARHEARDHAARTTTVRRAGYMRLVKYGLSGAVVTLAFGTGVGLLFAGVVALTEPETLRKAA